MSKLVKKVVEEGQAPEEVSIQQLLADPDLMKKPIGKMDLHELRNAQRILREVFDWDIKPFVD